MVIRPEHGNDREFISAVIVAAFRDHPYSHHNEQDIVDALRAANSLTVSLVAVRDSELVGYVACSPVLIDQRRSQWFGLGPIAVRPDSQNNGVGAALMRASIERLSAINAEGIVLLGDPGYYNRFGFIARVELQLPGVPASHFLSLPLQDQLTRGVVSYHSAFE